MPQRWIPLECNPEVYNKWAKGAGLVGNDLVFQDVYGLDEELLAMVEQPVKAVIFLFPGGPEALAKRYEEDVRLLDAGQPHLDPNIFWVKQTIRKACGTTALIHALTNADVTLSPVKPLAKFIEQCQGKDHFERAKILETTEFFAEIHHELARAGQSDVPTDLNGFDCHYMCFVQAPDALDQEQIQKKAEKRENKMPSGMRLIELDGTRLGPVDRGESNDLLTDVAKLVKETYLKEFPSDVRFNIIALGGRPPFSTLQAEDFPTEDPDSPEFWRDGSLD